MPKDRERARRWIDEAQNAFHAAHDSREFWDSLVRRDEKPVLDPKVTDIGYYMTPDLEDNEHIVIDVLSKNPTRYDGTPLKEGTTAEKIVREIVLWTARHANLMNVGNWVDAANAAGIARHGYKVMRLTHKPITEPEVDDEDVSDEEERREAAMKARGNVWCIEDADNLSAAWLERGLNRNVIVYETDKPVIEAYEDIKIQKPDAEGKSKYMRPSLQDDRLTWVGDDTQPDKSVWDKTLRHVVVEYKDPDQMCPICKGADAHPLWAGVEYLYPANTNKEDAEEVQTYTLPFRYQPSFRVTGGRVNWLEKDPDTRYRPMLHKLLVEASVINWCETMLMTLANRDSADSRVYGSLAKLSDAVAGHVPQWVWDKMAVPLPDAAANEIPLVPMEILSWPTNMAEMFKEMAEAARLRFDAAKINPFVAGTAFDQTEKGTATMGILQTEQANQPFDRPLVEMDRFWWELWQDVYHAIRLWDYEEDEGTEQKFYERTTGDEQLRKGHADPGQDVYLSASKLKTPFDLVLKTERKTRAEEDADLQRATFLYDRGDITEDDYYEMIGIYDVEGHKSKLDIDELRRLAAPMKRNARQYALATVMSELMMLPIEVLMNGMPVGQTMVPGVSGPQGNMGGQPTVQLPAIDQPGNPTGVGGAPGIA